MTLHSARLSDDEKRDLKRDGFVILRNAVARNVTARAKAVINQGPTKIVHGDDPAINGLYNDSVLRELMLETMGPHTAPINAQVAVTMPHFADAVVRRKANPTTRPGHTSTVAGPGRVRSSGARSSRPGRDSRPGAVTVIRMNVFFRIRRFRSGNPYEGDKRVGWGVSDHPDRALNGDFLEYPDDYDPFNTSIDRMCDHWSEWDFVNDCD